MGFYILLFIARPSDPMLLFIYMLLFIGQTLGSWWGSGRWDICPICMCFAYVTWFLQTHVIIYLHVIIYRRGPQFPWSTGTLNANLLVIIYPC